MRSMSASTSRRTRLVVLESVSIASSSAHGSWVLVNVSSCVDSCGQRLPGIGVKVRWSDRAYRVRFETSMRWGG
jgi:hypothetical protein